MELPPPTKDRRHRTAFVGGGGRVLSTSNDNPARYTFTGAESYVRARVEDRNGLRAWTQDAAGVREEVARWLAG